MSATSVLGCAYAYEASEAITIDGVDEYHGVTGLTTNGCNINTTHTTSLKGAIANTADNATVLRCTDVAHGLTTGQYVSLTGMGDAAHVGLTRVTVIDPDLFDCDNIVYNSAADTGTWARGASLKINTGRGGIFDVTFSMSLLSAGVNKNYRIEIAKNATMVDTIVAERKIAVSSDLGNVASGGPIPLAGGDVVWVIVRNTTDATNLTIEHMNLSVKRI